MKKYFLLIFLFSLIGIFVLAEDDPFSKINYPIPELGNCNSKDECATFCDQPENMEACLNFAEANNLMAKEEIETAKKMVELGETSGPGGCKGTAECQTYCDEINHIQECVKFAEENNLLPPAELEETKKIAAAMERGVTPPNCKGKTDCDVYCSQAEHMEECITFAEAAGFLPPEELEEAKKMVELVKQGITPPPCGGKEQCDAYCAEEAHIEECITFAQAAGFMRPEEAEMMRKTKGKGPGGCKSKEECDAFCENEANMITCINFAEEMGMMSSEEAEQARKMAELGITGGPGDCQGKEECEAYCNDVSHMTECIDFGVKTGTMTPEEAERAKKMAEMGAMGGPGGCQTEEKCKAFCENPDNTQICLDFSVKIGDMTAEQAQQALQGMQAMQRGGPGGCQNEEECKNYCNDPNNLQECSNFMVQQGFMSPEEAQQMQMQPPMQPPKGMQPAGEMIPGGEGTMPMPGEWSSGMPMPSQGVIPLEGMVPSEGGMPGMMQPPSPEEIERMRQEGMQQMMPEEGPMPTMPVEGMMPTNMPQGYMPPEGTAPSPEISPMPPEQNQSAPQSFLDRLEYLLANILSVLGFQIKIK